MNRKISINSKVSKDSKQSKMCTTIRVSENIKIRLTKIGRMGDSYARVIERLLDEYEKDVTGRYDKNFKRIRGRRSAFKKR